MELAVFIQKNSDEVISELLNIPIRTVAAWRRLERAPKPLQALEIIHKSDGLVTWKGIYQPFAQYQTRRRSCLNTLSSSIN